MSRSAKMPKTEIRRTIEQQLLNLGDVVGE